MPGEEGNGGDVAVELVVFVGEALDQRVEEPNGIGWIVVPKRDADKPSIRFSLRVDGAFCQFIGFVRSWQGRPDSVVNGRKHIARQGRRGLVHIRRGWSPGIRT